MTAIVATTQAELDAILADPSVTYSTHEVEIRSPHAVWIEVRDERGLDVIAYGSSTVRAYGSSTVSAYGYSTVIAYDSSTVSSYDSSTVSSYGSSTVSSYGSSTVIAYGSSTVRACGYSTVSAYDSSTVRAYDSSTVRAYGSSTVRACGYSTVSAYGSSTVRAYDSSTVIATPSVAVHKHITRPTITGGVVIDHTGPERTTAPGWAEDNGATVNDGMVTLYKALPKTLTSGISYGKDTAWPLAGEVSCDDWDESASCGGGLHLSPSPGQAWAYLDHENRPRFLECVVAMDDIVPILGGPAKCKAPRVTVVREVDVAGRPVGGESK